MRLMSGNRPAKISFFEIAIRQAPLPNSKWIQLYRDPLLQCLYRS
jgi:hypothetical protein